MELDEIEEILVRAKSCARSEPIDPPGEAAWDAVVARFGCEVSPDYHRLFAASLRLWVDLTLLGPNRDESPTGYESIIDVYDGEVASNPSWNSQLLPFCAIGNGDYFCFLIEQPIAEKVYYVYHEDGTEELESPTVEDWIRGLTDFLSP